MAYSALIFDSTRLGSASINQFYDFILTWHRSQNFGIPLIDECRVGTLIHRNLEKSCHDLLIFSHFPPTFARKEFSIELTLTQLIGICFKRQKCPAKTLQLKNSAEYLNLLTVGCICTFV